VNEGLPPLVLDHATEHTLKNHLAIVIGYSELLLMETAEGDPHRADVSEMHRAATAMLAILSGSAS
jgi:hypothetical protein